MGKIVQFNGITRLDLPPDRILSNAMEQLESVVIIGYDTQGNEYFATNLADGGTVLWLLERCKKDLLELIDD